MRCQDRTFRDIYRSPAFVYASTHAASQECFQAVTHLLATRALNWLVPMPTFTSRQLLLGRLSDASSDALPDLVFKRSNFRLKSVQPLAIGVVSSRQEIRMALALADILEGLRRSGRLWVPDGFTSLTVKVETPIGLLVDRVQRSTYAVFGYEHGYDTGETLLFSDPPIHGAANYSRQRWQEYCAIMRLIDTVVAEARQLNLVIEDRGVHQVLYRAPERERALDVVLIDAERIHEI